MSEYDVVIIGGGAAGLSAALVLSRARRRVLVVDSGSPRNAPAAHMHGFLSREGMPPAELLAVGRAEVAQYGGAITAGLVESVARTELQGRPGFTVGRREGVPVWGRRLLVTTGLTDELPAIPGLRDRWARDVLHCPYCHGYEVRDQRLGVLWHGPQSNRFAQIVRQWSPDVVLFAPPATLTQPQRHELGARGIGIVEGTVDRLVVTDDRLRAVHLADVHLADGHLADGRTVPRDALFVPPRFVANDGLLAGLGCELDGDGWAITGVGGSTSVPGVWVAGNVANPRAQVITAAGEGSAAAIAINADLVDEDVATAVALATGAR